MNQGFFTNSQMVSRSKKTRKSLAKCGSCELHKNCLSPKMPPHGECKKGLMVLAEMPGAREDKLNKQLVGKSGQYLRRKLRRLHDIDLDRDVVKHNATNCRAEKNRDPKANEIDCCRPFVLNTVGKYKPKVILLFGQHAVKSLIGHRWKKDLGGITKWRGYAIPDADFKCWLVPTYHPAYIMRETSPPVAELIFERDLKTAVDLLDKPLPDFVYSNEEDRVQILKHPEQVNNYLDKLIFGDTTLISFDYEATGLKPYREGHEIVTASISENPFHATAFPMYKESAHKFKRLLECEHIKKIVHNLNFEKMWSKIMFDADMSAESVFMDTMLTSHIIDNRSANTSLKFQAYVNFGICDYDSHLDYYMKAEGSNDFNKIKQAPLRELLIYNGLDSMFTFRLGVTHMKNMGIDNYGIKKDPKSSTDPSREFNKILKAAEDYT